MRAAEGVEPGSNITVTHARMVVSEMASNSAVHEDGRTAETKRSLTSWRIKWKTYFAFGALIVVIAIVWGLFSLPTIFYYLSPFEVNTIVCLYLY